MWNPGQTIPTNLIAGFLGTGKTTAIRHLIQHRPPGERWSVFINEYGMVSIDQAFLPDDDEGVQVEELGGGCFCCTMAYLVEPTLARLIRRTRPDRLLIEPSGAGHPSKVIDMLRGERFASVIDLRATIALVDPKDWLNPRVMGNRVFTDQIQMADVVAINWTDQRPPEAIEGCRTWIANFEPPKLLIAPIEFGQIDRSWLDIQSTVIRRPQFADAHPSSVAAPTDDLSSSDDRLTSIAARPQPKQPLRLENSQGEFSACGWIFSPQEIFCRHELTRWLSALPELRRLKGVLHCADDWWAVNCVTGHIQWERSAYRHDSRLEIIVAGPAPDWRRVEEQLSLCQQPADES